MARRGDAALYTPHGHQPSRCTGSATSVGVHNPVNHRPPIDLLPSNHGLNSKAPVDSESHLDSLALQAGTAIAAKCIYKGHPTPQFDHRCIHLTTSKSTPQHVHHTQDQPDNKHAITKQQLKMPCRAELERQRLLELYRSGRDLAGEDPSYSEGGGMPSIGFPGFPGMSGFPPAANPTAAPPSTVGAPRQLRRQFLHQVV